VKVQIWCCCWRGWPSPGGWISGPATGFLCCCCWPWGVPCELHLLSPALKLKQNGWLGNYALGASYIALPWWAGQALFGQLTWTTALLTLAYSLAGLGIAVVNDFKSVEGDRAMG
jgi:hypothetical protein